MSRSDDAVFEAERPRLHGLAYRMLGSLADADDVVQETAIRWQRLGDDGRSAIERPAAWLTTVCSRLALDQLSSARRRREIYVGPWLPEPVLTDVAASGDPADDVERAETLTLGFLVVLDRLAPVERAVFLLADVFGESFADIAQAVGRSEEACRQIASRARRRVRDERRVAASTGSGDREQLFHAFLAACLAGDVDALRDLLLDDVVLVSDGGADVRAARHPIVGIHRVTRFVVGLAQRTPPDAAMELHEINHEPGMVVLRDGRPWMVMAVEIRDDRIAAVRMVLNPDKLRHLVSP